MALGWHSKNKTVTRSAKPGISGATGDALSSDWKMVVGLEAGTLLPLQTVTPRDVEVVSPDTAREAIGRQAFAHFLYNNFTTLASRRNVRFSLTVSNVSTSGVTGFILTDPGHSLVTADPASDTTGVVYSDRNNSQVVAKWAGTQITEPYLNFHSPGSDSFRFGLEILNDGVRAYWYNYVQPGPDTSTIEDIHLNKFMPLGSLMPYGNPDREILYLGGLMGNTGDSMGGFWIEELEVERGGGPPTLPGPYPIGYGLYKSQTTLHGLLANARMSDFTNQ